jgi:hypothetical protein
MVPSTTVHPNFSEGAVASAFSMVVLHLHVLPASVELAGHMVTPADVSQGAVICLDTLS